MVKCPRCGKDITDEQFEHNSDVDGHIDVGYDCTDCMVSIYVFKIEPLEEE